MSDLDYKRMWIDCTQVLEEARQEIDDLKTMNKGLVDNVSEVAHKYSLLKAELVEARKIIEEESASHFSTDDDTPCFCGLCEYHRNQEA